MIAEVVRGGAHAAHEPSFGPGFKTLRWFHSGQTNHGDHSVNSSTFAKEKCVVRKRRRHPT